MPTVCQSKINLAILMESSSSINYFGKRNYQRMRKFVQRLIASFAVGGRFARISLTVYASRPQLVFGFSRFYSKYQMMRAVKKAPYIRGGNNLGRAIRFCFNRLFRLRSRRKNALVVITDGKSNDRILKEATKLKKAGVNIIAVGLGKAASHKELRKIASTRKNVFFTGFKTMQNIVSLVKRRACKSMYHIAENLL